MFAEIQIAAPTLARVANLAFGLRGLIVSKDFLFHGEPSTINAIQVSTSEETRVTTVPSAPSAISVSTPEGNRAISPASIVRVEIPLDVMIVSLADLDALGPKAATGPITLITLLFDFHISAPVNNQARMRFLYRDVDLGTDLGLVELASSIRTEIYTRMTNHPMTVAQPLGADAFADIALGASFRIYNIGACMDAAEDVVIVMMELDHPADASFGQWSSFYTQNGSNRLGANNFALFFAKSLFIDPLHKAALNHLDKLEAEQDFIRDGAPRVSWRSDFPGARIEIWGQAVDLCPPVPPIFWEWLDLDVKGTIDISIEPHPENTGVRVRAKIEGEATDPAEVVACISMMAGFWPVFGLPVLLSDGTDVNDPNYFLAGVVLGPFAIAAAMVHIFYFDPSLVLEVGQIEQLEEGEEGEEFIQDIDIGSGLSFTTLPGFGFSINDVSGHTDGLQLNGEVTLPSFAMSARLKVNFPNSSDELPEFYWNYKGSCHGSPNFTAQFVLSVEDLGLHEPPPRTPLEIGSVQVLEDPLNQFGPYLSIDFPYIMVSLVEHEVLPTYKAERYPCKLLIHTTGGARLITIPGIPEDPPDKGTLYTQFKTKQLIDCKKWTFGHFNNYHDLLWLVDPAPDDLVASRLWDVSISGAMPGTVLEITDGAGQILGSTETAFDGAAHTTYSAPLDSRQLSLSLREPDGFGGRLDSRPAGKLRVSQTLHTQRSFLRFARPAKSLASGRIHGTEILIATFENSYRVFNLERLEKPRLAFAGCEEGIDGATAWDNGLIAWGVQGARYHDLENDTVCSLSPLPTQSVLAHQASILLLGRDGIEIYDHRFKLQGKIPIQGCSRLRSVGKNVELEGTGKRIVLRRGKGECPKFEMQEINVARPVSPAAHSCSCRQNPPTETHPGSVGIGSFVAYLTPNGLGLVIDKVSPALELSEEQMRPRVEASPDAPETLRNKDEKKPKKRRRPKPRKGRE